MHSRSFKLFRDYSFTFIIFDQNPNILLPPGGGTLGLFGWGCAAGTLEPLAYTKASLSEFCYPILD